MKTWTTQAEARLTEYLSERCQREGLSGEDAAELKDDLRRHIHEEAERETTASISLMQLETLLGRLDAGYRPEPTAQAKRAYKPATGFARFIQWTFGVVLPLAILMFEALSGFCAGVFFDPIPTWYHAILVALVPLANAWFLTGKFKSTDFKRGIAAGGSLIVALGYGLLFFPLAPLSLLALIFFGMGFLSLTPILSALVSWRLGKAQKRAALDAPKFRLGWRIGALGALLAIGLLEAPALWTRIHLMEAQQEGPARQQAIACLRGFHSEPTLLRACYEGNRGTSMATDISGWSFKSWQIPFELFGADIRFADTDSEKMRDVFFRVTGKSFNSVKPPRMVRESRMGRNADVFSEVQFDSHLGGDDVAVRIKGLDLTDSRLDLHLDAPSQLGYGEWTMVFHNDGREAREARCQVRLPQGGHVSRLTLWVNGEPREAAFNSVAKVKAAYKAIAVVQRRDPVLVTMVGPDTVMVQCFPVPAHGDMKIRFGVTAPLSKGHWELPRIIEHNFGTRDGIEHAVWLQSGRKFDLIGRDFYQGSAKDGDGQSLTAGMKIHSAFSNVFAAKIDTPAQPEAVWCEDRFAKAEEKFLIRKPVPGEAKPPMHLIVAIDGSASLASAKPWILQALKQQPGGSYTLILADDGARKLNGLPELESYTFSGGRDNEPALREAVRLAKNREDAAVVWLHGPQAVKLSQSEALLQMLQRGTKRIAIHALAIEEGPNRLAEALYQSDLLQRAPGLIRPDEDLGACLAQWISPQAPLRWEWKRSAETPVTEGRPVWDQLAREWAAEQVGHTASPTETEALGKLAARYQLVTPLSGAVVLETAEQYAQHGLEPVDPSATPDIPNVPEPSTPLLVMLATLAAALRRNREAA